MGALYEITKREHEREELRRYLAFWNIITPTREAKLQRLIELENELRYLRLQNGVDSFANMLNDEIAHKAVGSGRNDSTALLRMKRFEAAYDPIKEKCEKYHKKMMIATSENRQITQDMV